MISYLTVDRVEGNCAACELELIDVENSKNIEYKDRETLMIDIMAYYLGDNIKGGDILLVEHYGEVIVKVLGKDEGEKRRRIEALKKIGF